MVAMSKFALLLQTGLCAAANLSVQPGECTLQAAVDLAAPGDTLVLADGTFTCSNTAAGVVVITKDLTIKAQNSRQAVIDGQNSVRAVKVQHTSTSGLTVAFEGLEITNGKNQQTCSGTCGAENYGAGVYIENEYTTATFTDCKIYNNNAAGSCCGWGGGVYVNRATTTFDSCEITANNAQYTAGGIYFNLGIISITNTQITDNSANYGGGFYGNHNTLAIINSQITGNTANNGAAFVAQSAMTITCSTVSGAVAGTSSYVSYYPCTPIAPPLPAPLAVSPSAARWSSRAAATAFLMARKTMAPAMRGVGPAQGL